VVDVALWRPEDVPHGPDGYALKPPTARDVAVAVRVLRRCLEEMAEEWTSFRARGSRFVISGIAQLKVFLHIPEFAGCLNDSFVFHPCKWIMDPDKAYPVLGLAVKSVGKNIGAEDFKELVEIAASASAVDFYANESAEHRAARIQSQLDFAANESPQHRKARVDALKATISRETLQKHAARIRNLDFKMKCPEKQAELKAKYQFTIGRRCQAIIDAMREKRFLKRSLETPHEQLERNLRRAKHWENWHASRRNRTDEQRAIERLHREAAWTERRPRQRVKKANQLTMTLDLMDGVTRAYHYKELTGHRCKGDIRGDPFGARLMAFYDAHPGTLEEDQKAFTANATAKLKANNYSSQKEYEERKRIEKWGPDHASLTRGEKLKMAYSAKRREKDEAAAAAEGVPEEPPKEKWLSQKLYRERKKKEDADRAAGLPVELAVTDPKLIARGQKIAAAWAKKRAAKAAGIVEESRHVAPQGGSSSSDPAARPEMG